MRNQYGFDGIVCTDWRLLSDVKAGDQVIIEAKCWGVEHLTIAERAKKAVEAVVDQFGGETCPEVITDLVKERQISEERIDDSVRRLLREKFRLGLFDIRQIKLNREQGTGNGDQFFTDPLPIVIK